MLICGRNDGVQWAAEMDLRSKNKFISTKAKLAKYFQKAVKEFNSGKIFAENKKLVRAVRKCEELVAKLEPTDWMEKAFKNMFKEEVKTLTEALKNGEVPVLKSWLDMPLTLFLTQERTEDKVFEIFKDILVKKFPELTLNWGRDGKYKIFCTLFYGRKCLANLTFELDCTDMSTFCSVYIYYNMGKVKHLTIFLNKESEDLGDKYPIDIRDLNSWELLDQKEELKSIFKHLKRQIQS